MTSKKRSGPSKEKVKAEYVAGATPDDIAKKYGIKSKQVRDWAYRGGWRQQRDETRQICDNELPRAVADALLSQAEEIAREQVEDLRKLWSEMMEQARKLLHEEKTKEVPTKVGPMMIQINAMDRINGLKQAAAGLKDAQSGMRKALGLEDKPEKGKGDEKTDQYGVIELPALDPPPAPPEVHE